MGEGTAKVILVVEDQPLHMKLAVDLLQLNGFQVLQATSGKEAIALLKKEKPDLVLLDIGLPDQDGYEVLKAIKKNQKQKKLKVIALMAFAQPEDEEKIRNAGFDGFFPKPIDPGQLVPYIEQLLEKS